MTSLALGPSWLDPTQLISTFGLIGVLAVVFAESGLLVGFFLPGDSLLFKQENVAKAGAFFERHGPKAIVLARFVPVIRTFTPVIAGVTALGYFLGQIAFVRDNIEFICLGIVLLSVLPVLFELARARRGHAAESEV
ncbi:hypothetical protein AB0K43_20990 [Kitasatospora sp. NPDC049258]|uniref:hypothetical protein n=1 Tax=Kitasatospora sp. NPDC049258 TaxID=3155394 RepID=UPI0034341739